MSTQGPGIKEIQNYLKTAINDFDQNQRQIDDLSKRELNYSREIKMLEAKNERIIERLRTYMEHADPAIKQQANDILIQIQSKQLPQSPMPPLPSLPPTPIPVVAPPHAPPKPVTQTLHSPPLENNQDNTPKNETTQDRIIRIAKNNIEVELPKKIKQLSALKNANDRLPVCRSEMRAAKTKVDQAKKDLDEYNKEFVDQLKTELLDFLAKSPNHDKAEAIQDIYNELETSGTSKLTDIVNLIRNASLNDTDPVSMQVFGEIYRNIKPNIDQRATLSATLEEQTKNYKKLDDEKKQLTSPTLGSDIKKLEKEIKHYRKNNLIDTVRAEINPENVGNSSPGIAAKYYLKQLKSAGNELGVKFKKRELKSLSKEFKKRASIYSDLMTPEKAKSQAINKITDKVKDDLQTQIKFAENQISNNHDPRAIEKIKNDIAFFESDKGKLSVLLNEINALLKDELKSRSPEDALKFCKEVFSGAAKELNIKLTDKETKKINLYFEKEANSLIQAPVTQAPVTQAPVTQAPVTQAPVTQTPVIQTPVIQPTVKTSTEPSSNEPSKGWVLDVNTIGELAPGLKLNDDDDIPKAPTLPPTRFDGSDQKEQSSAPPAPPPPRSPNTLMFRPPPPREPFINNSKPNPNEDSTQKRKNKGPPV